MILSSMSLLLMVNIYYNFVLKIKSFISRFFYMGWFRVMIMIFGFLFIIGYVLVVFNNIVKLFLVCCIDLVCCKYRVVICCKDMYILKRDY